MAEDKVSIVKKSLLSWIKEGSLKLQIVLFLAVIVAVFARLIPLEMQKRIVNEAIEDRRLDRLIRYSCIYLGAFIAATGLKQSINMLQTLIAQQTVAQMRNRLFSHILTLPLLFFRKTQSGLVVTALVKELATAGDFIGMAIAVPASNILMLAAFTGYLVLLNPLLAVVTMSIYPLMFILIPRLQKRVNRYNKKRLAVTRELSGRVGEAVDAVQEIQANGAFRIENEKFGLVVKKLKKIRILWKFYKYAVKALNNLLTNFGRFLVFALGGYLAIQGRLELGALVAFLSAQEKLYEPWKELVQFYQAYQQASVTYRRTMDFFEMTPQYLHASDNLEEPDNKSPARFDGRIDIKEMSLVTEDGNSLLEKINLSLQPGQHLALVGFSGSGKSTLAQCIVRLHDYTTGRIEIDGQELPGISLRDIIHNIGFVAQVPFIFEGSIEDNLLYSLLVEKNLDQRKTSDRMPDREEKMKVLQETGIFVDVLGFGLNSVLDDENKSGLKEKLLKIRRSFQKTIPSEVSEYIETYRADRYLDYSSVLENIVFGDSRTPQFSDNNWVCNDYFMSFLVSAGLETALVELGADIAKQTLRILNNVSTEALFFEESPIMADEVEDYGRIVKLLKTHPAQRLSDADRKMLLRIALRFTPGRHNIATFPQVLKTGILEARKGFKEKVSEDFADDVFCFYQFSKYLDCHSIITNIVFGKVKDNRSAVHEGIHTHINRLLIKEMCLEDVVRIGMQYQVGSKGDRLSGGQRQKLAIARVVLKNPAIFILDEATSGLDNRSQSRIQELMASRWKGRHTVVAVVHRLDTVKNFDKIAVMKAGRIVEMGAYSELMEKKAVLYELVNR